MRRLTTADKSYIANLLQPQRRIKAAAVAALSKANVALAGGNAALAKARTLLEGHRK